MPDAELRAAGGGEKMDAAVDGYLLAFVTGVLGGAHCLGMCGGFALAAAAGGQRAWPFHLGRLVGYAALGAAAGAAGMLLDLGGAAAGVHRLRAFLTGGLLLLFGLGFLGLVPRRWLEPGSRFVTPLLARARHRTGAAFPFALGLPIGLLPCGLLYPMYAAAAGTASALRGALLLLAFGAGTVPALGATSLALERLGLAARQRLVRAAGVALLVMGAMLLWQGAAPGTAPGPAPGPGLHQMH